MNFFNQFIQAVFPFNELFTVMHIGQLFHKDIQKRFYVKLNVYYVNKKKFFFSGYNVN